MNTHDLADLERLTRVLRFHYGSTLEVTDPENREQVNVVELLEDIVSHLRMDERSKDAPRGRHIRGKAYIPTARHRPEEKQFRED